MNPDEQARRGPEPGGPRLRLWAAVLLFAFPSAARAQDGDVDSIPDPEPALDGPHDPFGLGFKKLGYSLGLKIAEVFDDNIFLAARDRTSDFISVFMVTAKARHDYGAGSANLAYRGRERIFARHDEFNGPEHFLDASASLTPAPFKLEGGFEWRALKDPFDALQSSQRVDSRFDREYLKASGDFGRFDVEGTAGMARFTVDDEILERGDYRRWDASVIGLVEAWPKVSILGGLRLGSTRYDDDTFSDFDVLAVAAGARGTLSAKTRTEARVGYSRAEPRGESLTPAEKFSGFVAEISTTWEVGEKHELRIDVRREPTESVLTGLAVSDEVRIGYKYAATERWSAQGLLGWDQRRESDGSGRRHGLQARAGVQWAFQSRLHADFGVLLRTRQSRDPDLDYENLRISLGIGVQW